MKSILKKQRKGIFGLNSAAEFIIGLLILSVIAIAVFLALGGLDSANLFPANSANDNATTSVIQNVTEGTSALFAQTTTWMVLLGVVILILIIAVVIAVVKRLGGTGAAPAGL